MTYFSLYFLFSTYPLVYTGRGANNYIYEFLLSCRYMSWKLLNKIHLPEKLIHWQAKDEGCKIDIQVTCEFT